MPSPQSLPWSPLYTLERAGLPELTIQGVVSVWAGSLGPLFNIGKTQTALWTRSLLKPFQFLTLLPVLQESYPELEPRHYAVMLGSHNGEAEHEAALKEILAIGQLEESHLLCPESPPLGSNTTGKACKLSHPCSGKHLAHILWCKAQEVPLEHYLFEELTHQKQLRILLGWYLGKEPENFLTTEDGCGLPTLALSGDEMAHLFCALTQPLPLDEMMTPPTEIEALLPLWGYLRSLMQEHPTLLGGQGRLDTRITQGKLHPNLKPQMIAKEGADGLLGVGIMPSPPYKNGLGILIKMAHGYDPQATERVLLALLEALGHLPASPKDEATSTAQTLVPHFNFEPLFGAGFLDDSLVL